jgi:hypothetical protein
MARPNSLPKKPTLSKLTDEEQIAIAAIRFNPALFKKIKNPTQAVLEYGLDSYPQLISKIDKPTNEMWLRAIKRSDGSVIKYHPNPSEELQFESIHRSPMNLKCIKDHTPLVANLAIRYNGSAWRYVKACHKTDELMELAARQYGFQIRHCKNPTEKTIMSVLRRDPGQIRYLKKPSIKAQCTAFVTSPYLINSYYQNDYRETMPEDVALAVIRENGLTHHLGHRARNPRYIAYARTTLTVAQYRKIENKITEYNRVLKTLTKQQCDWLIKTKTKFHLKYEDMYKVEVPVSATAKPSIRRRKPAVQTISYALLLSFDNADDLMMFTLKFG